VSQVAGLDEPSRRTTSGRLRPEILRRIRITRVSVDVSPRTITTHSIVKYSNLFLISRSRSTPKTGRNDFPGAPLLTGRFARGPLVASHKAALPCSRLPAAHGSLRSPFAVPRRSLRSRLAVAGRASPCRALARFARANAHYHGHSSPFVEYLLREENRRVRSHYLEIRPARTFPSSA